MNNINNQDHNAPFAGNSSEHAVPDISAKILAEAIYDMSRFRPISRVAISMLLAEARMDNRHAIYALLDDSLSAHLTDSDLLELNKKLAKAYAAGDPFAKYITGCMHLHSDDENKAKTGVRLVIEATEQGVAEGFWSLALYYARKQSPQAYEFGEKAVKALYRPAITASWYAELASATKADETRKSETRNWIALRNEVDSLSLKCHALSAGIKALQEQNRDQAEQFHKRHMEAEALLTSRTTEMLRDEKVIQLQAMVSHAEDEWLKAKMESEHAEAAKVEAERKAEDLTRRNKYLVGLLRKNGIPFNEYESSSSSENGESCLGLAS